MITALNPINFQAHVKKQTSFKAELIMSNRFKKAVNPTVLAMMMKRSKHNNPNDTLKALVDLEKEDSTQIHVNYIVDEACRGKSSYFIGGYIMPEGVSDVFSREAPTNAEEFIELWGKGLDLATMIHHWGKFISKTEFIEELPVKVSNQEEYGKKFMDNFKSDDL